MIYNRLHEGMPLGIDATIRFATGNYTKPLTESQLAIDSPYNTRTNVGLPPGPINSPGLAAIKAAAHPAEDQVPLLRQQAEHVRRPRLRQDRSRIRSRRRRLRTRRAKKTAATSRAAAEDEMPRLAVIGFPVAHSRSPAMQNAALAELGLGEEWSYEALEVAPEEFEARVAASCRPRASSAPTSRPAQGGGAGRSPTSASEAARRDRRRQHAELRRGGRIRGAPTPTPAGCWRRCRRRRWTRARWSWRRRRGAGGGLGAGRRGRPGRGLEPDRGPGRGALRRARRHARRRARPGRVRPDRQHHQRRPRGEDPFERAAAERRAASPPASWSSTWSTASGQPRCCEAAAAAGASDRRRPRDPRPAGRPLAAIWTGREPPLAAMRAAARG